MSAQELEKTMVELTAPGKGALAADESSSTIEKRFKPLNIPCIQETRRDYRDLLFSTARPERVYQRRDSVRGDPRTEECGRRAAA